MRGGSMSRLAAEQRVQGIEGARRAGDGAGGWHARPMSAISTRVAPLELDHGGRTLRGWEHGTVRPGSPAALLVHGFSDTGSGGHGLWVPTARALVAAGIAVRSYDRLGHGASDGDFADVRLLDEVDQVSAMIRALARDAAGPVSRCGRPPAWSSTTSRCTAAS
jgi:pimeloyl-ACP methyl ester carboxylesterase